MMRILIGLAFAVTVAATGLAILHEKARVVPQPSEPAPYLDLPAVVERENGKFLQRYYALRSGLRVRYVSNIFSSYQPDMMWFPAEENGKHILAWQTFNGTSGLWGVYPGN